MFNLRVSIIAGGLAFILSLMIGVLSRSSFPALVLRPLLFGILFFGLPVLISLLVSRFLPELLDNSANAPDIPLPGSKIDIRENAASMPVMPAMPAVPAEDGAPDYAAADESEEGLGNITDAINIAAANVSAEAQTGQAAPAGTIPAGLDQDTQKSYNDRKQGNVPLSEGGFDILPDLESLAGAFMPAAGNKEEETYEYPESDVPKRSSMGSKSKKMDVDFSPKDLAAGIRTIIDKQEG
ncbi:MAG: hypothetical protein FWD78_03570 [Treponema sp.]|nr:hypothetical protein [Treponema sp.]